MIRKKEYVETILLTAVQAVCPLAERLIYQKHDDPKFHRWEAVSIELAADDHSTGRRITLDVTGKDVSEISKAVQTALKLPICSDNTENTAKPPKAATSGGYAACPSCGQLIRNADAENIRITSCDWCGQLIDWRI